jgi:hypothetical protein
VLLTAAELIDRLRLVATVTPPSVDVTVEIPDGPAVELSEYRDEMGTSRLASIGQPGVWLDRGPTGAGKSTADMAAFAAAGRSLSVQPTHANCEDVVSDCLAEGLDAAAYPSRLSNDGENQNCWNKSADIAEAMGFCVIATVCNAGCEYRRQCVESGYLGCVATAKAARVAVATHARATHAGLAALADGRDYIAIHEDCLDILAPQLDVDAADLQAAQAMLTRMLTDPDWLDRFGDAYTLDDDGETFIPDERRTKRRDRQYRFLRHLADTVDRLIALAAATDDSAEIPVADTLAEPPGVQPLLFEACRELGADFRDKSVWPLVFFTATGEFFRSGVLIDGSNADKTEPETGRQSHLSDTPKPTAAEVDCVAV